jgi:signal recognition particle receptor subunit beta
MQIDVFHKQITVKLVYYGPALSGKTTNLLSLHTMVNSDARGNLMTLETKDDRTLFFDLLPFHFTSSSGVRVRIKLFTVPGQVIHNATRRIVLQSVDGVGFIADSQMSEIDANARSFENLGTNLADNGLSITSIPLVIQFNKRDMPNVRPDEEIDRLATLGREPVYKAVAVEGTGVAETFLGLFSLTWGGLESQHGLSERFGIRPREVLDYVSTILNPEPATADMELS